MMPVLKARIQSQDGFKVINLNRRKAIHERCLNCMAWRHSIVTDCPTPDCLLYSFRSGAGKQNGKNRTKAIHDYCLWCVDGSPYEVAKCVSKYCPLFTYRNRKVDWSVNLAASSIKRHGEHSRSINSAR